MNTGSESSGRQTSQSAEVLGVNRNAPEQPDGEHCTYEFRFRTTPPLDGYRFTVTKAVDENGNKLAQGGWGQSGNAISSDNQVSRESTNTATALITMLNPSAGKLRLPHL
jgi:hypothetical protein